MWRSTTESDSSVPRPRRGDRAGIVRRASVRRSWSRMPRPRTPVPATRCERSPTSVRRYGLWLHVDGAFGAFLPGCPRAHAHPLVDGLDLSPTPSRSTATSGLNLPERDRLRVSAGRRAGITRRSSGTSGRSPTLGPRARGWTSMSCGVEASRPWRGAATWAVVKHLGREGIAQLVDAVLPVLAAELGRLVEACPPPRADRPRRLLRHLLSRHPPPGESSPGPELDDLNRRIQAVPRAMTESCSRRAACSRAGSRSDPRSSAGAPRP